MLEYRRTVRCLIWQVFLGLALITGFILSFFWPWEFDGLDWHFRIAVIIVAIAIVLSLEVHWIASCLKRRRELKACRQESEQTISKYFSQYLEGKKVFPWGDVFYRMAVTPDFILELQIQAGILKSDDRRQAELGINVAIIDERAKKFIKDIKLLVLR